VVTPNLQIINYRTYKFDFKYYIPTSSTGSSVSLYYGNVFQLINNWNTKGVWTDVSVTAKLTTDINQYGQYNIQIAIAGAVGEYIYLTDFRITRVSF